MTKYSMAKEIRMNRNGTRQRFLARTFGFLASSFIRHWVVRHSDFFKCR